jgi:hypothetical protein
MNSAVRRELPLFTGCLEVAFSETELPVMIILGNWASAKYYSRKLHLSPVPIPETFWGRARLNLYS